MLIVLIDYLTLCSIVILIFAMFILIIHMYRLAIVHHLAWHVDSLALYTILIFFEHDVYITIHLDYHSLHVDMSGISVLCLTVCRVTALLLRVCMSLVRVGRTTILLFPTLLVSVILFISVLTFASVRPCVCLLLWPSQRLGAGSSDGLYWCLGAFWRWLTRWCRLEFDHWRPI